MYKTVVKPFFDLFFGICILLLLSPILMLVGLLLMIFQGGAPFFTQRRPGKNGKIFTIIKFRTMSNKRDSNGELLPDAARLTRIGRFVRSTSLDELPQLFNVLMMQMSLVGPRPLLPEYLPLYDDFQRQRHLVKPGITGYAQVNGRNAVSWEKKFELDVYYVKNCSFVLDLQIILNTIRKVIIRDGINAENTVTTEPFTGNQNS